MPCSTTAPRQGLGVCACMQEAWGGGARRRLVSRALRAPHARTTRSRPPAPCACLPIPLLASQVFIPELGRTFRCPVSFRVFGAQNPLQEGGGRKGLPRSFLNRFTRVHVELLGAHDLRFIAGAWVCARLARCSFIRGHWVWHARQAARPHESSTPRVFQGRCTNESLLLRWSAWWVRWGAFTTTPAWSASEFAGLQRGCAHPCGRAAVGAHQRLR